MKKIVFLLLLAVISVNFIVAQDGETEAKVGENSPKAKFDTLTYNYGKIKESDTPAKCEFVVKNIGTAPLIIQSARAGCGCTTPEYSKEPILPGKTSKIYISYDTKGRVGPINKTVTVFTNVPDEVYKLKIVGEVIRSKE